MNGSAPFFEDLAVGQSYDAPAVTVTTGHAALYQALTGDRLLLPLDHPLAASVAGAPAGLVHPLLVTHLSIGQSTWASQRVRGNLFYRNLVLLRPVLVGDTLSSVTRVIALRQNRPQAGRAATGMVALEITTRNQRHEEVLRYWRCPMIACRDPAAQTGRGDDLDAVGGEFRPGDLDRTLPPTWDLAAFPQGPRDALPAVGQHIALEARDTVTMAPELVRLTLNLAMAHLDAGHSPTGQRLVYGGHTISTAFAQLTRVFPAIVTLLAWERCDHLGPVHEGDRLRTEATVLSDRRLGTGRAVRMHLRTFAARGTPETEAAVLDWVVWILCPG